MSRWQRVRLGEVVELQNGGGFKASEFTASGIPLVRVSDFTQDSVDLSDCKFLSATSLPDYTKFLLKTDDVLVSTVGSHPANPTSPVGKVVAVPKEASGSFLNQNAVRLRAIEELTIQKYVRYLARTDEFKHHIAIHARGSANHARIAISMLEQFELNLPPLPTQRRIAEILGRLDDKIEVNRRINHTLEAMVQALFKHWFVNFGPFQDGPFVESELGLIPEGWKLGTFGQISKNVKSIVDPASMEVDTPYIGLADMPKGSITLDVWGVAGDSISGKSLMKRGQFLFGKLRPYFRKVGVVPIDGVCSTDILVIEPKQKLFYGLILCHLFDQNFIDYTDSVSDGTRMPRVSWNMMAKYPIVVPPLEVAQQFSQIIANWVEVIVNKVHENRTLTTTRDYLLPKLLSGEIVG